MRVEKSEKNGDYIMEGRTVAIVPEFAPLCKKLLYFAAHKELEKFVKNVDPWAPLGSTS